VRDDDPRRRGGPRWALQSDQPVKAMIRMNGPFVSLLKSLRNERRLPLTEQLDAIINDGIVVIDDCYLLSREANANTHVTINDFPDKTEYECFINHIHIDDYVSEDLVNQSISYASKVFHKWNEQQFNGELISIIAFNEIECSKKPGATVRFHHRRQNESWLADDLDGFDDAVLEISSSDLAFFDLF
jgi:hypothetical protein